MNFRKFQEELDGDLKRFIRFKGRNGYCIFHHQFELIDILKYSPAEINLLFYQQKLKLKSLKSKFQYVEYLLTIPEKNRISSIGNLEFKSNKDYWETARFLWNNISNKISYDDRYYWKDILTDKRDGKEYFMNETEREYFNNLPEKVIIYRGCINCKHVDENYRGPWLAEDFGRGIAFSLSKNVAEKYVKKYSKFNRIEGNARFQSELFTMEILKKDILGFLNDKNEFEILTTHFYYDLYD